VTWIRFSAPTAGTATLLVRAVDGILGTHRYRRIHGELAGLGIIVAPSTVWQILRDAGIDPAPRRDGPRWAEFLRSQAQGTLALDFFTADLLNGTKVYVSLR
jgi:putative transposase